ncbi:hypothetical protein NDU88_009020 [Pleurodeles waltl]|uniref:Uncharacterized protein n=1 Tax=Pleurodeles waltl TaxID=8319 RepID=A0AAV7RXD9_PLEWA|nr:hypothetical protein NDU88_009020 [Pleurodeles waltl]
MSEAERSDVHANLQSLLALLSREQSQFPAFWVKDPQNQVLIRMSYRNFLGHVLQKVFQALKGNPVDSSTRRHS